MARPFQLNDDSDQQDKNSKKHHTKEKLTNTSEKGREKSSENSPECGTENQASDQNTSAVTNIYRISNSNFVTFGPTFINVVNNDGNISKKSSNSSVNKSETERQIKVKKGIFDSKRTIANDDILVVAAVINEDWKKLFKKLPGVTLNGSQFQQTVLNAMEGRESSSMTEAVLCTWKKELPEFSTIGNLSKTLFSIGYPDVVTYLNP